jgi:hypothetical protein
MVHKLPRELALMSPAELKQYYLDEEKAVFGHDVKHDRDGDPIEQGLGSPDHPTHQSVQAYKKYGIDETDYAENLKRLEDELAAYNSRHKRGPKKKAA